MSRLICRLFFFSPWIHSCFFFLSDALISKPFWDDLMKKRHFFPSLSGKGCRENSTEGIMHLCKYEESVSYISARRAMKFMLRNNTCQTLWHMRTTINTRDLIGQLCIRCRSCSWYKYRRLLPPHCSFHPIRCLLSFPPGPRRRSTRCSLASAWTSALSSSSSCDLSLSCSPAES